ncbi:carbohydrate binding domain-containing protein [Kitasatospora sp. SUK 42]|uniref:carbohydrate binding domain-containing protein n=1 Tax=Kitasatospora sp. SUK 42 TaxID=1588882 RepID=UPI0018CB1641|nr:carbohydrate binding domain-containing protein [Kitasatospora sp. SUK 42]MBV2153334.1 carbohydrate binding domain-containing protein [Kitasatospora sp. SUK 42]
MPSALQHAPTHRSPAGRTKLLSLAAATVLAAGGLATLAGNAAADANLLANAGFESGALDPWSCSAGTGSVVNSGAHSGTYALKGAASASDTAQCGQTVSVQPNTTYNLSAWVQGQYVYLGATGSGVTDPATWTAGGPNWQQLSTSFTTGPSTTSVTVYLHGWYGQGAYLADDVSLTGPGGGNPSTPPTTGTPTGTPTGGPTGTPTGGPSTPPPNVALPVAPYIDMGAWPTPSMPDMAKAGTVKGYTMGFVTGVGCKASWFNAYDPRTGWAKDQVDALRAAGGDVKLSFGGASGTELAAACTTVDSLFNEYDAVVNAYNLRYVDYDIEGAAIADTASNDRRSAALAKLQQAHPGLKVSLTLPVLPEGLTSEGVAIVKSARDAGVNLDLVNIMAMDYYRSGTDYGNAAVQAAQSLFGQLKALYPAKTDAQLWSMVGVTPMIGENDDHQIYNQAAAQQLVTFAKQNHLGLLAFWDATRDANACTGGSLSKCTNITQQPYEFAKIFSQYAG